MISQAPIANMREQVDVLIADDHPMIRTGLSSVLNASPRFRVVGTAGSGTEAIQLAVELRPQVILMDLRMPNGGGLDAIKKLRVLRPECQTIIFTTAEGEEDIFRGLQAGAKAYLLKGSTEKEIVQCVDTVARGGRYIQGEVAAKLAQRIQFEELSARELEILEHLASGKGNKAIARMAGIGDGTVKFHVNNIISKLGAATRTEAVTIGTKRGLIELH